MRIAVIGAGITGLGAAWLLSGRHEVTLFEKEPRLGGHSHTVDVSSGGLNVPVDTGFIVYNLAAYPNLIALFDHLDVPTAPTSMGFSVSLDGGRYEYSGNGLSGLFGQWSNVANPLHWRMASDIFRFFREARALGMSETEASVSLGGWLRERRYSDVFIRRHILPMGAAIWSTPAADILSFPAASFARFFANHGLLQATGQPPWRTVRGGSREYVARLMSKFRGRIVSGDPVVAVSRSNESVLVSTADGQSLAFDRCLFACHADEALRLLSDADALERSLLAPFRYVANETILHRDVSHMPKRRRLWTSWNYLGQSNRDAALSVTYWMNSLQPLATAENVFVTLNPSKPVAADKVVAKFHYSHPLFDKGAVNAQEQLWQIQGRRRTWYAGSYFGYGFHEDGLQAGLHAAEMMGDVARPWRLSNPSDRLKLGPGPNVPEVPIASAE
ncbi:MAG: FAD-dependent oxidoreductase [Hyphomicrobium sp.]|nr:FAD-dependent oxidoreductase [Hyphomicrobium sp.]